MNDSIGSRTAEPPSASSPDGAVAPSEVVKNAGRVLKRLGAVTVYGRVRSTWGGQPGMWLNGDLVDSESERGHPRLRFALRPNLAAHYAGLKNETLVTVRGPLGGSQLDGAPEITAHSIEVEGVAATLRQLEDWRKQIEANGWDRPQVAVSSLLREVWFLASSDTIKVDLSRSLEGAPVPRIEIRYIPAGGQTLASILKELFAEIAERKPDLVVLARGGTVPVPSEWDRPEVTRQVVDIQKQGIPVAAALGHSDVVPLTELVSVWSAGQPSGIAGQIHDHQRRWCDSIILTARTVADGAPLRIRELSIAAQAQEQEVSRFGDYRDQQVRAALQGLAQRLDSSGEEVRGRVQTVMTNMVDAASGHASSRLGGAQTAVTELAVAADSGYEAELASLVDGISDLKEAATTRTATRPLDNTVAAVKGALARVSKVAHITDDCGAMPHWRVGERLLLKTLEYDAEAELTRVDARTSHVLEET